MEIFRNKIKLVLVVLENEMGWACGTYGGGEWCAQGVGGET
jgi:hypothetical protein